MKNNISRKQLLETLKKIISESELLDQNLIKEAETLNDEKLEKLIIVAFQAVQTEKKLNKQDKRKIAETIIHFFEAKKRIFEKAQQNWLKQREIFFENQENVIQELLIKNLD